MASTSNSSAGTTVARAGSIMIFALTLSRILGLLRDTVMASQFGIDLSTDAYRIAVTIPDTIFFLIAGGGLSSAFIPVFSELLHTDREGEAWDVFSTVAILSAIFVTVLIAVAWIFAPQIAAFMSAGKTHVLPSGEKIPLTAEDMRLIIQMSRIMLPAQFAFMVGSILLATLYSRKHFGAPGLAPNVYNVGIIVGAIIGPLVGIGIAGMSWGALIGAIVGNLVIPILVMSRLKSRFRFRIDIKADGVRRFFRLLIPVILGFSLPSVAALITQKFASFYAEGTNTVMTLSNNLMQAPLGIFGQSLALAAFPVLAQFYATNRMDSYRSQMSNTLRTVIYLALPSSAVLLALAPQLVQLIYGYGKAADPEELARVALSLRVFTVGICAWCVQPVLMRGFFSVHKTFKPVLIGTVMTAIFILLCWLGIRNSYGYLALPWSTNIAAIALAICLYLALEGEIGTLDRSGIATTFFKGLVASAVTAGAGYAASLVIHPSSKLLLILAMLVVLPALGWIYFHLTKWMGMQESLYFIRAMERFDRRPRPISQVEAGGD